MVWHQAEGIDGVSRFLLQTTQDVNALQSKAVILKDRGSG